MRILGVATAMIAVTALAQPSPQIQIDPAEPNAYTHLDVKNDPRDFQFGIVSDRTGGHRAHIFEEGIRKLNLLNPEFIMSVGDGIEGYTDNIEQMHREWDELDAMMAASEAPFFYVPGNHDISNDVMLDEWKKRYGSPYYFFVYQDVLFIILNSEDPPPKQLSQEQLAFVEETLAKHANVRWTLFFLHVPLWTMDHATNWEKLEALVADRDYTVFAGHTHDYLKIERQGRRYIVLATTGGGSQLLGPARGEFDQVAWVTMTDEGPIVANLFLNGIWNENVRTPEVVELIRPLEQGLAVTSTPIIVDDELFIRGESTLTLTNPADRPMTIEAWIQAQPNLGVSPAYIEREIPAKGSETVPVTVHISSLKKDQEGMSYHGGQPFPPGWVRAPWSTLAGPQIDYRITYAVNDREPVEYTNRHQIMIDGSNPCNSVNATVDGDLGDWFALPNACVSPAQIDTALHSWNGPADSSFRFATGYDDDFLYIAVHVTDDELLFRDREEANRKDGVEIRLDARPAATRASTPIATADPEKSNDVLFLGVSLGDSHENTTLFKRDFLPEGTTATAAKGDSGYFVEAAVPIAYLNTMQGADWKDFRLNVTAYDYDQGYSYPRVAIWWRPNWATPQSYPESGVFVKQ